MPDSFDTYAIHRPSGEISAPFSSNDVVNIGAGITLPTFLGSGSAQTSSPVCGFATCSRMKRPSSDQLVGEAGVSVASLSSPEPSAALMYVRVRPFRVEAYATVLPSGDQTGLKSFSENVRRVAVPRSTSMVQMF